MKRPPLVVWFVQGVPRPPGFVSSLLEAFVLQIGSKEMEGLLILDNRQDGA